MPARSRRLLRQPAGAALPGGLCCLLAAALGTGYRLSWMKNRQVARILYEIADLLELEGVAFKPRAYQRAGRVVETLAEPIEEVTAQGRLEELPGVGEAIAAGVRLAIGTDAHAPEHLDFLELGLLTARRGWAEAQDVLNTLGAAEFLALLER